MSRIRKAYETRFRWLLRQVGARREDEGVRWLVAKAQSWSASRKLPLSAGLTWVFEELASRPAFAPAQNTVTPNLFFCDAGLGGLARWLRASGYEALWVEGIDDDELLERSMEHSATVLTTDSMLMERRLLRDRVIPAFWLPPTLTIRNQLALTFREFKLEVRNPRCMSCGGELRQAEKEALRERIPPRTYRWLNEYFTCVRCGKLFWHGTHWSRISQIVKEVSQGGRTESAGKAANARHIDRISQER